MLLAEISLHNWVKVTVNFRGCGIFLDACAWKTFDLVGVRMGMSNIFFLPLLCHMAVN